MFRPGRWRSEKNKIKAVFKLQFHATQVTLAGVDALMISVIPADVGKPTAKLEKATVRDGRCYWENAVCETVKFDREAKSGKIHERIYRFVVGMGSTKAGVVGEATIDFSNYAEATKMSTLSLPLKNSKSEILLHVSIQRLQDSVDHREVEESENHTVNLPDRSLRAQLNDVEMGGSFLSNSVEDGIYNKMPSQNGEINVNRRTSSGSDITSSSSDSSSGFDTPRELQLRINNIPQDPPSLLSSLNHSSGPLQAANDVPTTIQDEHNRPKWGWLGGSAVEVSADDSSGTPREVLHRIVSQEASDDVEKLKVELAAVARQAEVTELELQTLRRQIVKEGKKGQDLSREVITLKKERDSLREECDKLKSAQKNLDEAKATNMLLLEGGDLYALVAELRQELNYEKDLNANLRIQLQKTQESNSELILAVRDLDEMLEQKNAQISHPSNNLVIDDGAEKQQQTNSNHEEDDDDDEEQRALEQLVREHSDAKELYLLEQKIMDLQSEIEMYRREKDEVEVQMEQLALDYEILKQENHDMTCKLDQSRLQEQLKLQYECTSSYSTVKELEAKIEKLEDELKKQEIESLKSMDTIRELENHVKDLEEQLEKQAQGFEADLQILTRAKADLENILERRDGDLSKLMDTISDLEKHVKDLEEELEKQAQGFEADLEALTCAKVEQEQRAIRAEETLRKTRQQNANTAERLQEEFKRLSIQMASTFEANEKLATKALVEANELRLHRRHLEDMLQNTKEELESQKDHYESRLQELSDREISLSKQIERMHSEIEDKSMKLENQEKCAEDTHRLLSKEILSLKADIETLTTENQSLSQLADREEKLSVEMECMQTSIKEMELLIEQGNNERSELESRVAGLKKEAEKSLSELNKMRSLEQEKESILANLQPKVHMLKTQRDELRHSLNEDELEKQELRKQVILLRGDLKKKEDAIKSVEKKLKDGIGRAGASEGLKPSAKTTKSTHVPFGTKKVANLKERIRLLEGHIKLKEAALEDSSNSFLEKEKDLQNKIEELEKSLDVLHQNSASLDECTPERVVCKDDTNCELSEEMRGTAEHMSSRTSLKSDTGDDLPKEETKASLSSSDVDELLKEMALLKERNKLMEDELKEMQERYSEISLKFAEVEGERQQLVMRVRNLKNAKKS